MMRFSVLLTVLKLRFSRVRKYFWFLEMTESWPESLKAASSRTEVCSGEEPCLEGRLTRASFSTCLRVDHGSVSEFCIKFQLGAREAFGGGLRTAISKSTYLSVYVLISLLKQNL